MDALLLGVLSYNIGPGAVMKSSVYRKLKAGDRNIFKSYTAHCKYKVNSTRVYTNVLSGVCRLIRSVKSISYDAAGGMHFSECIPPLYLIDKSKRPKQMASIKVKFRPSTVADHEGTIYYQIIHERKVRQLLSNYKVFPDEWDESRSMVITTQKSERKSFILSIRGAHPMGCRAVDKD